MKKINIVCCFFILFMFISTTMLLYNIPLAQVDKQNIDYSYSLKQEEQIESSQSSLKPKNAYAIIIGVKSYGYVGNQDDLPYSLHSSGKIWNLLKNEYNFADSNIIYLKDTEASPHTISKAFNKIASKITENDVFVFYFTGHGTFDSTNKICFYDWSTMSDQSLASKINSLNCSEKYVILDTCYSGGFIPETSGSGVHIMTSCRSFETCFQTYLLQSSVFTYFFKEGAKKATDSNDDGVLSMEEIFAYAKQECEVFSFMFGYYFDPPQNFYFEPQQNNQISGVSVLNTILIRPLFYSFEGRFAYNFTIYGTGLIENLKIITTFYNQSLNKLDYKIYDLTESSTTEHGFESYNGTINYSNNKSASSWGFFAEVLGNKKRLFSRSNSTDIDNDGLEDVLELFRGLNPQNSDTDHDFLNDYDEYYGLTNPLHPDSDIDGLLDGFEVYITNTNPLNWDSDGDGDSDGAEIKNQKDPADSESNLDSQYIYNLLILIASVILISIATVFTSSYLMKRKIKHLKQSNQESQSHKYIKVCDKCGFENKKRNKYCISCGKQF